MEAVVEGERELRVAPVHEDAEQPADGPAQRASECSYWPTLTSHESRVKRAHARRAKQVPSEHHWGLGLRLNAQVRALRARGSALHSLLELR